MAYEKLFNEIYAVVSLKYLWRDYHPGFVKHESPDWVNDDMDMGLEVSQALLPEDGAAAAFIEKYLGCPKEELPQEAFDKYGSRLHFYNGRFWAIEPKDDTPEGYSYKGEYRFRKKLEKRNSNYEYHKCNALYLFVHPYEEKDLDIRDMVERMIAANKEFRIGFDCVFLNCEDMIYIIHFDTASLEFINVPPNSKAYIERQSELLRLGWDWDTVQQID